MKRITGHRAWHDGIKLKDEMGYSHVYQRLAEYENTGKTPKEIMELTRRMKLHKDLLKAAVRLCAEVIEHRKAELSCFYALQAAMKNSGAADE